MSLQAIILIGLLRLIFLDSPAFIQAESTSSQRQSNNFDISRLIGYALGPAGGAMNYMLPNTMQGFSSDLSNGYKLVSTYPSSSLNRLQSNFQAANNNALDRYNKLQSDFNDGFLNTNQLLFELYQMLRNPQEMCRNLSLQAETVMQNGQNLSEQAKQAMEKAGSQLSNEAGLDNLSSFLMNSQKQVTQQAPQQTQSSLMSKLSGGFIGK